MAAQHEVGDQEARLSPGEPRVAPGTSDLNREATETVDIEHVTRRGLAAQINL